MRTVFAIALLGAFSHASNEKEFEFMNFVAKWNKSYSTAEEYALRFKRWVEVDAYIREVNRPGSDETHTAGHNKFSTWTAKEFENMMTLKSGISQTGSTAGKAVVKSDRPVKLQSEMIDWRTGGCVAPVKDQASCGSCWSFATTAANESSQCIATGASSVVLLSEQQLVDCDPISGGCDGGWYYWAWQYLTNHGQESQGDYPYTAKTEGCKYASSKGLVSTDPTEPYVNVSNVQCNTASNPDDCDAGIASSAEIMSAIAVKPNAVAVNASSLAFQTYSSGVLTSTKCSTEINHAITAVGYNASASTPYYIVRNSWGVNWGADGYILIGATGGAGICGINQFVAYPKTQVWSP